MSAVWAQFDYEELCFKQLGMETEKNNVINYYIDRLVNKNYSSVCDFINTSFWINAFVIIQIHKVIQAEVHFFQKGFGVLSYINKKNSLK